eukprot:CAMPEP_0174906896 /NCGR_PEP_ID=MMETSP0167-20121228/58868_1 /TAXON_ID=38298 /ORGANISM="Rhodella maculata, Strain CCMP736" /LENGTH=219 /DNA_ID=CAMNT_0016150255 /DNA_START=27 /DNA_END=683 /DNA_ORIENTATION=+
MRTESSCCTVGSLHPGASFSPFAVIPISTLISPPSLISPTSTHPIRFIHSKTEYKWILGTIATTAAPFLSSSPSPSISATLAATHTTSCSARFSAAHSCTDVSPSLGLAAAASRVVLRNEITSESSNVASHTSSVKDSSRYDAEKAVRESRNFVPARCGGVGKGAVEGMGGGGEASEEARGGSGRGAGETEGMVGGRRVWRRGGRVERDRWEGREGGRK